MKHRKSHFRYTSDQRNGIFYLILLIIVCQIGFYFWSNRSVDSEPIVNAELISQFEAERDSLLALKNKKDSLRVFKYNPNYIDDYRGYQLGMSVEEIDKLLAFRNSGKFVNSEKEFQKITGVTDSLMAELRPQLKFPRFSSKREVQISKPVKKMDINLATAEDLQKVNGIGAILSERIIKYRDLLHGFSFENQMEEVYHLKPETIERVWEYFEIKTQPKIDKLDINKASLKELISISYIDYELAKKILEYRDMVAEIQELEELQKIDGFPVDKLDRIALYLSAN